FSILTDQSVIIIYLKFYLVKYLLKRLIFLNFIKFKNLKTQKNILNLTKSKERVKFSKKGRR
ncbi:MAG: hypothetical protein ACPLZ9_01485, partial [Candidatus Ratteibacteria bacterium]